MNAGRVEALLTSGARELAQQFESEIGRQPSVDEALEILTYGVATLPDDAFSDLDPEGAWSFELRRSGAGKAAEDSSSVLDLNDNLFVFASDLFGSVMGSAGRAKSSTAEFSAWLGSALKLALASGLLLPVKDGAELRVELVARRLPDRRPKPGDVVAIPAEKGKYFLTLVLTRNQFGVAYGLFHGRHPLRMPLKGTRTERHFYSSDELVTAGRWKIVGHDERLLSLFPSEPEIFHRPQKSYPGVPEVGPFGSGETISGRMRHLTEDEAVRLGLLDGSYRQFVEPELFAQFLERCAAK